MTNVEYTMVVMPLDEEDGGGFVAYAPDLFGCMGDGDTSEAAIADLRNAIFEWITEARRLGREIPVPGSGHERHRKEMNSLQEMIKQQDTMISLLKARLTSEDDLPRWSGSTIPHLAELQMRKRTNLAN